MNRTKKTSSARKILWSRIYRDKPNRVLQLHQTREDLALGRKIRELRESTGQAKEAQAMTHATRTRLRALNASMLDVLQSIEWGEKNFGSLVTNRHVRRRDVMRAVKAGLAESAGQVALCDGDGAIIQPERHREGFRLTTAGRSALDDANREAGL